MYLGGNVRSKPVARALLRWFAAYIISLKQSLRSGNDDDDDADELRAVMTAAELQVSVCTMLDRCCWCVVFCHTSLHTEVSSMPACLQAHVCVS